MTDDEQVDGVHWNWRDVLVCGLIRPTNHSGGFLLGAMNHRMPIGFIRVSRIAESFTRLHRTHEDFIDSPRYGGTTGGRDQTRRISKRRTRQHHRKASPRWDPRMDAIFNIQVNPDKPVRAIIQRDRDRGSAFDSA